MRKEHIVLIVAIMVSTLGCGAGSGPGMPPTDTGGPGHALDATDRGAAGQDDTEVTPPCLSAEDCDDDNPCTTDKCEADGCRYEAVLTGECDDGDPCTVGESCQGGMCKGGDFVCECRNDQDCGETQDQCRLMTCDLEVHKCVEGPREDGTPCDDLDPCTWGEACWDGECRGGQDVCPCEKDEECPKPEDECSPLVCDLSDHLCKKAPKQNGTACDDGDLCTVNDTCQGGLCRSGAPKVCDDQDGCTVDSCDPATGACKHDYLPQPGCCEANAECDDRDPCTIERCVNHKCVLEGEPAGSGGVGCANVTGCSAGYCSEEDGVCRSLNLQLPAVLHDWDLTKGTLPKGMRWVTEAGVMTPQGVGPASGKPLVSFAFPGHFVPAGVRVLLLTLGEGLTCEQLGNVQVKMEGAPAVGASGCALEGGRAVLGFPYVVDAYRRLDLEVLVKTGARVARATLYLWAGGQCRPLGPAVAIPGSGLSDLSVASSRTTIGLGHRLHGQFPRFGWYSLWDGVKGATQPASGKMDAALRHRTSLVPVSSERFLLAYDGVPTGGPSRIEVALLDAKGQALGRAFVPRMNDTVAQYEPYLTVTEQGAAYLVFTSSDADAEGLGVRFVSVQAYGNDVVIGIPATVNVDGAGDQTLPVMAWAGSGGVVVWKSSGANVSFIRMRKVTPNGPTGPEYAIHKSSDFLQSLAVVQTGDYIFVAATTDTGALTGYRVLSDFSSPQAWTGIPVAGKWSDVTLLPAVTGVVLVATLLDEGVARVVQVPVSQWGVMGEPVVLSGAVVNATATPVLGSFGPFMNVLAFNDTLSPTMGAKITLLAPKCSRGPVSCKDNKPAVCTGFGGDGYMNLLWAEGWCP